MRRKQERLRPSLLCHTLLLYYTFNPTSYTLPLHPTPYALRLHPTPHTVSAHPFFAIHYFFTTGTICVANNNNRSIFAHPFGFSAYTTFSLPKTERGEEGED